MKYKHFSLLAIESQKKLSFFSSDISLFFQVIGSSNINLNGKDINIEAGEFFLANKNEQVSIKNSQGGYIIGISISYSYIFSVYPNFAHSRFENFLTFDLNQDAITSLQAEFSKFILTYANHSDTKDIYLSIYLNKLILLLINNFKLEEALYSLNEDIDKRIVDIIEYIDKNYNQDLTLQNISDAYFISPSTLSNLFKKETGELFSQYLNKIRISKSLEDLIFSSDSIENIALKHGFNSAKVYRRNFKSIYKITPIEYKRSFFKEPNLREIKDTNIFHDQVNNQSIMNYLYSYTTKQSKSSNDRFSSERYNKIIVDSEINRDQITPFKIIHVGKLSQLFDLDIFKEFSNTYDSIHMDYIGINSLYDDYPESYVNKFHEELSFYPQYGKFDELLSILTNKKIGIFYQINLIDDPTKSRESFNQLINFLIHVKNIGEHFILDTMKINFIINDYDIANQVEKFKIMYETINVFSDNIDIGVSIPIKYPDYRFYNKSSETIFKREFLSRVKFLSFSSEVNSEINKAYNSEQDHILDMDAFNEFVYKESLRYKKILKTWNTDLPIVLTEWNTLTCEEQNINGIFFRAAIILQEILKLDLVVDGYGFWLNAGLYSKYKFDETNNYNGLELFHNYNAPKPIYHVLSIASRLKGKVKFLGSQTMFLQDRDNYQLLIWNANYFDPSLSKETSFLESQSILYNVEIPYIEKGMYQIKRIDFNRNNGAVFYNYKNFNTNYPIDFECHQYIANISVPKISVFDKLVDDRFKFNCILDTNAITLLELKPILTQI